MRLENIETPALVLDMDAAEHNMELMSDYMKDTGLSLRPHYKSSKCTYIAHMQIKAGAKGGLDSFGSGGCADCQRGY